MFGMDVVAQQQIDIVVSDFPISFALWNGGDQGVDFWYAIAENWGFSPLNFRGHI